jgi:hypothetical protein
MAADERSRRLTEGLRAAAAEKAACRPADPPWSRARSRAGPPPAVPAAETLDPAREQERKRQVLATILRNYKIKLEQEYRARLEGKVRAADLYARQITYIEVWADLISTDLFALLSDWRLDGHHLVDIAQTPMARLLDAVRREHFAECGEPERPPPPAPDLLVDHGRFSTEPGEYCAGGSVEEINDQQRAFAERDRRDAEAQIAWEAKARRDYEERRERDASS